MTANRNAAIIAALALLAGCAPTVPLPTVATAGNVCRGVGVEGVLHGAPADPRVAWVDSQFLGQHKRVEVVFPEGFAARFTPNLEVLDRDGHVVAEDGDQITGGCVTGPDASGPLLILGVGSSDIQRR